MVDTRAIKPEDNKGGTFTQALALDEVTTAYVSPVPAEAPGVITAEPGTVKEEAIHFKSKDAGAGTISGLTRDYTALNGGTGQAHENGEDWEIFQSAFYVANLVDILTEGYLREQQVVARTAATTFTVVGNVAALYTTDRVVRFNGDNTEVETIVSSSYSAGTGLTTVTVTGSIPDPLTYVEIGIQAKAAAFFQVTNVIDEDTMASNLATKVPTQQSVKAYVDGAISDLTDGATVTVDLLAGAKRKHRVILGGNRAIVLDNAIAGLVFMVEYVQDATGSRTITHPIGEEDFATTDVNTTDDQITVGLNIPTGTRVQVATTTTLPAGISAATNYYIINVSSTVVKLATSLANALAGTDVDITDQGTGTHTLKIYTRWAAGTEPTLTTDGGRADYIGYVVEAINPSDDAAFVLSGHVINQGVV